MRLLSAMAEAILKKEIKGQCTDCGGEINKANIAHIVLAENVDKNEDTCLYYGFYLCDKDLNNFKFINNPTTISFNYNYFNKDEILTKLKKIQLLL